MESNYEKQTKKIMKSDIVHTFLPISFMFGLNETKLDHHICFCLSSVRIWFFGLLSRQRICPHTDMQLQKGGVI